MKKYLFSFGEWILIDGKVSGQYIHPSKGDLHTIDTNGMWNDYEIDRITKDNRYSN